MNIYARVDFVNFVKRSATRTFFCCNATSHEVSVHNTLMEPAKITVINVNLATHRNYIPLSLSFFLSVECDLIYSRVNSSTQRIFQTNLYAVWHETLRSRICIPKLRVTPGNYALIFSAQKLNVILEN